MGKSLNLGWSNKNITPHGRKVSLAGQFYERLTTEVDCDISVTAVAMDNGDVALTWVSCDLVSISALLGQDVRAEVESRTKNIDPKSIFLSATHTHTAPYIKVDSPPGAAIRYEPAEGVMTPDEFHGLVVERVVDAIVEANSRKISGCSIQTGVSAVATGCCRRGFVNSGEAVMYINSSRDDFMRMEAPNGGPMNLMYMRDENGDLKGVIAAIPCTAQILEHQFYISSDYVGRTRDLLRERYGENFFFLPLIASAGDLSPRNLVTKDFGFGNMYDKDGADSMAARVFSAVVAEEKRPVETMEDLSGLSVAAKRINLPGWVPTEDEYKWALSKSNSDEIAYDIADYVQKGVEPYYHTPLALEKQVKAILARHENLEVYKNVDTEICAIRFGDSVWVSNPFELFQDYGARMVAGSKARSLWSVQLVNDGLGYFPTKEAVAAGGYGATISSSRANPLTAGDILVRESIDLADSLFQ